MGDSFVGLQARLMSQALRKLTGIVSKTGTIAIFINQLREKVGVMYGNPETTPGGRALKFYASVRLDVRRGEQLKNGSEVIGNRTKVKVVKNKVAPPFRVAEFDIIYGQGISREGTLLDMAVARDIIHKSGAWFSYKDQRIGQGRENTRQYLKDNPEVAQEIDAEIRRQFFEKGEPLPEQSEGGNPPWRKRTTWRSWRRTVWRTGNNLPSRATRLLSIAWEAGAFLLPKMSKRIMGFLSLALRQNLVFSRVVGAHYGIFSQYGHNSSLIGGFWQGFGASKGAHRPFVVMKAPGKRGFTQL